MRYNWMDKDMVVKHINGIVKRCAEPLGIEVLSIVLYGSRAREPHNTQSEYEILILVGNETGLHKYIKLSNHIKLELIKSKLFQVKISVYTPDIFEELMYNDEVFGAFLYMICRENTIFHDKVGTFTSIKERISNNARKSEEKFLIQCIEFAKMLESEKWERKWEKTLAQYRYLNNRRNYF
jgi:uncharacterized protein